MTLKSRATGVGRGNGPGSRQTQFKDGMPSANANGRPKRAKPEAPRSIQEAISRSLSTLVDMSDGTSRKRVPQFAAMIEVLLNDYRRASSSEKLRILKFLLEHAPDTYFDRPREPDPESIQKLVAFLASEYEQEAA